jgi:hypothetical protein
VVELVPSGTPGLWNPMGAAIKNSDRRKAQALVGITISNNESLRTASQALERMGLPAIKARITHDATASGLNGAALCPPFSYPSFANGLQLVIKDCWMAKTDISRYFHAFPLAKECRDLFLLSLDGKTYRAMKCVFGFGPCPYYTSTWSAEYRRWIWRRLVPNAHMMNDWLTVARTRLMVEANLACMCAVLEGSGHSIQMEKNEVGQRIVYLGILIDSQRMTVSFEPVQARGMSALLQTYLNKIRCGRTIEGGAIRSVAGSLNWYSEVLQSGRLHVRSWWLYSIHKGKITAAIRRKLIADTQWWVCILDEWGRGGVTGREYPIFSASELLSDPNKVYVVQSDASGDDGLGYYHGVLDESEPRFYSQPWDQEHHFQSSHNGELQALRCFLNREGVGNKVLIWVSDSLSAVWSVNKGRCYADVSMAALEDILQVCDDRHLQILAVWTPRERNELADYLSHLSTHMLRSRVAGKLHEGQGISFSDSA